jgi:hypothetical protein
MASYSLLVDVRLAQLTTFSGIPKLPVHAMLPQVIVQIYLPEASAADTEILTAKASAVNISVLGPPEAEADPANYVVPEQFRSSLVDGKLATNPVTHG